MEGELFAALYPLVLEEARRRPRVARVQFSDAAILLVMIHAALHDRPVCWACQQRNWSREYDGLALPSPATVSRRIRRLSFWLLMAAVFARYQQVRLYPSLGPHPLVRRADSKPLIVGGFSKDRDARRGYATGGIARGYKLCHLWGNSVVPELLLLAPLNLDDAKGLAQMLPQIQGQGYLLADSLHDHNDLHATARRRGLQLLAPRKKPGTGLAHRRHDPGRLRAIDLLEGPNAFGSSVYGLREQIERDLGGLCGFAGGLQPLPSWVRGPRRVTLWTVLKLLINAARICQNHRLTA
jgi:hypothetical protein